MQASVVTCSGAVIVGAEGHRRRIASVTDLDKITLTDAIAAPSLATTEPTDTTGSTLGSGSPLNIKSEVEKNTSPTGSMRCQAT